MRRPAGWLVALVFVVGLALLLASILVVPRLLHPPLSAADLRGIASADKRVELQQAQAKLQNDARATLLQGAAGLLLVAGAVATWRQLGISREQLEVVRQQALESDRQAREQLAVIREGQITDRFTRAIEQLGSDKLEVRLGGIFALERIAKDSEPDRWAIADSLVAFVRTHAPWRAGAPESQDPHPTPTIDERLPWLAERALDVQEAVRVLGRRPPTGEQRQLQLPRVDLRRTWLVGAQLANTALRNTNLAQSWLVEAHLEDSDLVRADLRRVNAKGAHFSRSNLRSAYLGEADLHGARLEQADLLGASLREADLRGADLHGASLRDADLRNADLRGADLRGADLEGATLIGVRVDDTTIWPAGFQPR